MRREAGTTVTEPTSAGWYRDPFGRHERRYHTGTGWTEHVKDRNRASIDPPRATVSDIPTPLRVSSPQPIARPERPSAPATPRPARAEPRPVKATPIRVARPAREPGRVAVSRPPTPAATTQAAVEVEVPRTLHKRPPSSYLKPAPAMIMPTPVEHHRPRWPWVVVSIFVLVGVALATGIGFIDGAATEPRVAAPSAPKRGPHTITPVQFDFVAVGTTRARVLDGLNTPPAPPVEYRRVFPGARVDPSCIYYYARSARGSYRFCFGDDKRVVSKTTLTHKRVATRPGDSRSEAKSKR
jgi:hypothetical protein